MIACIESLKAAANRPDMDGPVTIRRIEKMNDAEKRDIENLEKRAYVRHGFDLAHELDREVLSKRGLSDEQKRGMIRESIPYSSPHTGYNDKDILRRMEQGGRPISHITK